MEIKTEQADSKVYEIGYILVSSIPEEKIAAEVASIKDILTKNKTSIIAEEAPQLQDLAYTMVKKIGAVNRRFDTGYFGWIKFDGPVAAAQTIEKQVMALESVLRHLFITTTREDTRIASKLNLEKADEEGKPKVASEEAEKTVEKAAETLAA